MKVNSARFLLSAVKPVQYPKVEAPEVAFAGRSNVGKSSLINSLVGRKGLVKTSKTPGKTQLLNFFSINDKVTFVDMPGYGFAKVPNSVKATWGKMVENYLKERTQLKVVIQLLDCRRVPNEDDRDLLLWLSREEIPLIVVFTKIDKAPKSRRKGMITKAMKAIEDLTPPDCRIINYSSHTGEGKRELWSALRDYTG